MLCTDRVKKLITRIAVFRQDLLRLNILSRTIRVDSIERMIALFQRAILSRGSDSIHFFHTVWQGRQTLSGHDDIIVVGLLNRTCKIFGLDKLISFVDKNNAVLNIVKLSLPKASFYHIATFITIQSDRPTLSIVHMGANHIHKGRFSRCTIPANNGQVASQFKFIFQVLCANDHFMNAFHFCQPLYTNSPAAKISSSIL